MLRYLLEKEFKQIRRDRFMPKIIFIIPIMQLIILPFAANFEMRNINLSIVDNDHSVTSMQLVDKVLSSGYFRLTDRSDRYDEALTSVESNESDIILEIPSDFERDLGKEGRAGVMIAASYWSLLAPAIELSNGSWVPAGVGFLLGGAFLRGIDIILPHLHVYEDVPEGHHSHWRRSILLVTALAAGGRETLLFDWPTFGAAPGTHTLVATAAAG